MTEHLSATAIITKTYNESTVLQFRDDGWFNMTKAANAFGKRLDKFWSTGNPPAKPAA